jgi:hypothetical protein
VTTEPISTVVCTVQSAVLEILCLIVRAATDMMLFRTAIHYCILKMGPLDLKYCTSTYFVLVKNNHSMSVVFVFLAESFP